MRRIKLPDLIVPDNFDHTLMCNLEVSICVRDRRRKDNGASGRCRTMSTVVVAGGVHEAWQLGLPMLISRINSTLTGELVWPADKPLPPEKPKAQPRSRPQPKLVAPPPPRGYPIPQAPKAPTAPAKPAVAIKPRPKAPKASWANVGEYPEPAQFQRPPRPPRPQHKGTAMARTQRQPDPFDDLEIRAPINTEYLGMRARQRREPVEVVKIMPNGLAQHRIVKAKDAAQADIFDDLLVED